MTKRKRRQLPNAFRLEHQFDPEKLVEEFERVKEEFTNVSKVDPEYFAQVKDLADCAGDIFQQANLTVFNSELAASYENDLKESDQASGNGQNKSRVELYRERMNPQNPRQSEHFYNKPTPQFTGSYFEKIAQAFKGEVTRVRLARLPAAQTLPPHIDYDPTYATRIIIPIITSQDAYTVVWRSGKPYFYSLCEIGRAYFLNTGFRHGVVNFGQEDRITLMVSINGQEDLGDLPDPQNEEEFANFS